MEKIKKPFWFFMAGLALVLVGYFTGTSKKLEPKVESAQIINSPTPHASDSASLVKVTRVIDGDTIEIEGGKRVRLIGMDTPEISKAWPDEALVNKSGETGCFGKEAADYATKLLDGQMVRLEKDVSEVDRYNRLLRYIYLGDTMVNDKLVRDGYARVYTYPPDVKYKDKFLESERFARENNLGLWSKCASSPSPVPISDNHSTIQPSNINCGHNAYNCSDFKTQAEAQYVLDYCGGSSHDIHRLDGNHDGRACETLP